MSVRFILPTDAEDAEIRAAVAADPEAMAIDATVEAMGGRRPGPETLRKASPFAYQLIYGRRKKQQ